MKGICKLLSVILICLLLTACAADKSQVSDNLQQPVDDNNVQNLFDNTQISVNDKKSQESKASGDASIDDSHANPVPAAFDPIICEFDIVTLKHTSQNSLFVGATAEVGNDVREVEAERQYTFYYDLNTDSFVDEIYNLLKQFDEAIQSKSSEVTFTNSALFYLRDGEGEEVTEFNYPNDDASYYGSDRIWVKISETQRRALTVEATEQFIELCADKGLTADNFFRVKTYNSMIDWAVSFKNSAPILLYDVNSELTAEQATEKMLYDFGKQLAQPGIDRYFYYENYSGWDFKLYSNATEDEKVRNLYNTECLTDNQYVVDWGEIRGDLVGMSVYDAGGYIERYFLEYEDGIWRLWLRDRP